MSSAETEAATLLNTAWAMFAQRGYVDTGIDDIAAAVAMTPKDVLRLYESKEQVLNACVEQQVTVLVESLRAIVDDPDLSAIGKLNLFISSSMDWKSEHARLMIAMIRSLYRDDNILLRHRFFSRNNALATPLLGDIIEQGVDEGYFAAERPHETAEWVLQIGQAFGEANARAMLALADQGDNADAMVRRVNLYFETLERVLGAPPGSIERIEPAVLQRFVEAAQVE